MVANLENENNQFHYFLITDSVKEFWIKKDIPMVSHSS